MADASDVTIEIHANAVPLMEHALRLARDGVVTRACQSNMDHVGKGLSPLQGGTQGGKGGGSGFKAEGVDESLVKLLADAQTSGGLLLSVAANRADELVASLKRWNTRAAAAVGRVLSHSPHRVVLTG